MKPLSSGNSISGGLHGEALEARPGTSLKVVERERTQDLAAEARTLAEELLQQEKERWAYEIHDGLTQTVAAAILQLEILAHRVGTDPKGAAADLSETATEMRAAMADIRSVLFELTAGTPDDEAPTERIRACVNEVAGRWNLETNLDIEGDLLRVPAPTLAVAQAVIHEALTNAAKHAAGTGTNVVVTAGANHLAITVTDRGTGLGENRKRFGMRMMERRVHEVGGTLDVASSHEGTRITANFPIGG